MNDSFQYISTLLHLKCIFPILSLQIVILTVKLVIWRSVVLVTDQNKPSMMFSLEALNVSIGL